MQFKTLLILTIYFSRVQLTHHGITFPFADIYWESITCKYISGGQPQYTPAVSAVGLRITVRT